MPAIAAAVATAPAPVCAAAPDGCRLTAAQLFDLADRLAAAGRADDAEAILRALAADPNLAYRNEARFRLGQRRAAAGDLAGAARLYRAILDEQPNAGRVRIELAALLARMGDEAAARRQLGRAVAIGLPAEVLPLVDRYRVALRSRRRLGGSLEVALAPNSNVNRATTDRTLQVGDISLALDRDARARSGIGAALAAQLFWRPAVTGRLDWLTTVSGLGNFYRARRFDDLTVSGATGGALRSGADRLSLLGNVVRRWFGGQVYSTGYGPSLSLLHPVGRRSQLQLDLAVYRLRYPRVAPESGSQASVTLAGEHAFSARLYGRLLVRGGRQAAAAPAFSNWSGGAEALVSRDAGRQTVYARAAVDRVIGDAPFALPPARRDDRLLTFESGVQLRRWTMFGLSPIVRAVYSENRSPVLFYRFHQVRVTFGLGREI